MSINNQIDLVLAGCGANAKGGGGFQSGNTCAVGTPGGGGKKKKTGMSKSDGEKTTFDKKTGLRSDLKERLDNILSRAGEVSGEVEDAAGAVERERKAALRQSPLQRASGRAMQRAIGRVGGTGMGGGFVRRKVREANQMDARQQRNEMQERAEEIQQQREIEEALSEAGIDPRQVEQQARRSGMSLIEYLTELEVL